MAIKIPSKKKLLDTYTKTYRMQVAGFGETVRTSIPREVVKREAHKKGLSIKEFVKHFRVEWRYNSFDGAYALFVPKEEKDDRKEPK